MINRLKFLLISKEHVNVGRKQMSTIYALQTAERFLTGNQGDETRNKLHNIMFSFIRKLCTKFMTAERR